MDLDLRPLAAELEGELHLDDLHRMLYATDASSYREPPLGVVYPRSTNDLRVLIAFANEHKLPLIPRAGGTSLAGQVVGTGLVFDVTRHLNRILELNVEERWVRVEPGVIRDELNLFLKPHRLFFAPETSTSSRAAIGGMIGNNSSGANSIVYGSTREHVISLEVLLSDGSTAEFAGLSRAAVGQKIRSGQGLEREIYTAIAEIVDAPGNRAAILRDYPKSSVKRRNSGYALDLLVVARMASGEEAKFNLSSLICGSEGTLAVVSEAKLNLVPVPPREKVLLCAHFVSLDECLRAAAYAMKYNPSACELMDGHILACSASNAEQRKNRFFIKGEPQAVLIVEFCSHSEVSALETASLLAQELAKLELGYAFPIVSGEEVGRIWALRKASLGLLQNLPGSAKAISVVEDTAVAVEDLPAYVKEFDRILAEHKLQCVHYGHVGGGELHLKPILDLGSEEGRKLFRTLGTEIAGLVKKYRGSLSGEHGDGRLRSEFLPFMLGDHNYRLLKRVKQAFDPAGIFNPGKIVDALPMDSSLRSGAEVAPRDLPTVFHFRDSNGVLQAASRCSGSGDCRKSHLLGGTMCPSFMATRNERDSTRGRANVLREVLTRPGGAEAFDDENLAAVLDLCLSCKGCKSECPSNVDIARLKAEFLQHYYDAHGVPLRARIVGNYARNVSWLSRVPIIANFVLRNSLVSWLPAWAAGMAPKRSFPRIPSQTLSTWYRRHRPARGDFVKKVFLFNDEFTNYQDVEIGRKAVETLEKLGIEVVIPRHRPSGRALISKGLMRKAKGLAVANVRALADLVSEDTPLIGIEPSAVLTLRDEYLDLVDDVDLEKASRLARHTMLFEEYLAREMDRGAIGHEQFTDEANCVLFHAHCHQKALASVEATKRVLSLPRRYRVEEIPSGCCGMAGNFGYEHEHYELSMQIGELVLFPAIRKEPETTLIVANGTSCRAQILDGTGRKALHPAEVLWAALHK